MKIDITIVQSTSVSNNQQPDPYKDSPELIEVGKETQTRKTEMETKKNQEMAKEMALEGR